MWGLTFFYIDRYHDRIAEKMEIIKKNVIIPTKVIFRNPKASSEFPFEITEVSPLVKSRARKKSTTTDKIKDTVDNKETKKETT